MSVLGIETATEVCGSALVENGLVLAEKWFEARQMHSEKLVLLIDETLRSRDFMLTNVDAIAVSIGPGSFSGLRIGLSVAKGLAFACGVPIIAVPTLYALAQRAVTERLAGQEGRILSLVDARRDEIYAALYTPDAGELEEVIAPCAVSTRELEAIISRPDMPAGISIVLMGDGAEKFEKFHASVQSYPGRALRFSIPSRERRLCRAASVAIIGEQKFYRGEIADSPSLEPLYVKEFYTTMKLQPNEAHR